MDRKQAYFSGRLSFEPFLNRFQSNELLDFNQVLCKHLGIQEPNKTHIWRSNLMSNMTNLDRWTAIGTQVQKTKKIGEGLPGKGGCSGAMIFLSDKIMVFVDNRGSSWEISAQIENDQFVLNFIHLHLLLYWNTEELLCKFPSLNLQQSIST